MYVCIFITLENACVVYLLNSDSQNHTLQDLTPYTTYTVSVRSHSTLTTGPFGTSQDITTLEDGKFQGKKNHLASFGRLPNF